MATDTIDDMRGRWLPLNDAAAVLGISYGALRLRMSRQTISTRVEADGQVLVCIPYDLTDDVRAGMTAAEVLDDGTAKDPGGPSTAAPSPETVANTNQSAPVKEPVNEPVNEPINAPLNTAVDTPTRTPSDQVTELQETRIAELKQVHAAQIADLKAVIVELADRHGAEIDRMMENHQAEVQRLVDLHHHSAKSLQEQVQHTAKLEAESKLMLIDVIAALNGRK